MRRRPRLSAPGVLYHVIARRNPTQTEAGGYPNLGAMFGYLLIRSLGYMLKDIASCLGQDVVTVSSLISRFADRMSENETLRKQAACVAADCQE
jgi:hypothetical protein